MDPTIRPCAFPPEIVVNFLTIAGPYDTEDPEILEFEPRQRNHTLFCAALVCRAWCGPAQEVLYRDVELCWTKNVGRRLLASFAANPALCALPRSVRADYLIPHWWQVRWRSTVAGRAVVNAAAQRWPNEEYERRKFVRLAAEEARRANGDTLWVDAADQRTVGSNLFWMWISTLSCLRSIDVRWFDRPVGPGLQQKLEPVFSALTDVDVQGDSKSDFIPAILRDVRVLKISMPPDFEPGTLSPGLCYEALAHLWASWYYGERRSRFNILEVVNPGNLVALILHLPDSEDLATLVHVLPFMNRLRSLAVRTSDHIDPASTILSTPFVSALSHTRIQHLTLSKWPSLELLSHVPSSIRSISLHFDNHPAWTQLDEQLADLVDWKARFLPALEIVGVNFGYQERNDEPQTLSRKLDLAAERVNGFELRQLNRTVLALPGQWIP